MKITNVFDAVRDGTYEEFIQFYKGNPNLVSENLGLSLLALAVVNDKNPNDKLKIVEFLLSEGADVNFINPKEQRNVLHIFFFNVMRPNPKYMFDITKLFVENGVDINCKDKYNAIPLKYAITVVKLPTNEIEDVYKYLITQGSDVTNKDDFDKSCIDYIKEYSWRSDILKIIEEYKDENQ